MACKKHLDSRTLKATFAGAIEVDGNAIKNSGSTDAISFGALSLRLQQLRQH